MNTSFDDELNKIHFFKVHPSYIPFIGDRYDDFRVLHIGESHFIEQTPVSTKYGISYFEKWWTDPCWEIKELCPEWIDTRCVISKYMRDCGGSYSIFINFVKSFSKVALHKEIPNISIENKRLYEYLAFMIFFQMPSLYEGKGFWKSLVISAREAGDESLAYKVWDDAVHYSTGIVDSVIEILNPKVIVITSISAGKAYKDGGGKYREDERVIYTSHSGYPFTWYKRIKNLEGKRGVDVMEEELAKIVSQ